MLCLHMSALHGEEGFEVLVPSMCSGHDGMALVSYGRSTLTPSRV
jgi:hypothetical protein